MAVTVGDIGIPDGFPHYKYLALDGDGYKINVLDASLEPDVIRLTATQEKIGRPIGSSGVPTRMLLEDANEPVFDVEFAGFGGYLVSEKFKNLVERFEPNRHQFWPISIELRTGAVVATKYLLIVCNRLDSINRSLTRPEIIPPRVYLPRDENARLVLDPKKINGCHLWREILVLNELFVSGEFWAALQDAGCTGLCKTEEFEEIVEGSE